MSSHAHLEYKMNVLVRFYPAQCETHIAPKRLAATLDWIGNSQPRNFDGSGTMPVRQGHCTALDKFST